MALVIGRGGGEHLEDVLPVLDSLGPGPPPGAGAVPRRPRRGAGPAVRGDPPPPPAGRARGGGVHRRRAPPAGGAAGPGRHHLRHRRAQRQPAAPADPRAVRRRRPRRAHADLAPLLRVQARHPARRRHRLRLPVPAQPVLGGGAAAPQRARRAGAGLRARPARDPGLPGQGGRPPADAGARLRPRGEVVPDRRHGLHRRAPPLGGPGRGAEPSGWPPTAWPPRSSTGTSTGEPRRHPGGGGGRGPRHRGDPAGRPPLRRPR